MCGLNNRQKTSLQFNQERKKHKKTVATFIIAFLSFSLVLAAISFLILLKKVNFKLSNLVDRKTTATTEETSSESVTSPENYSGKATVLAVCSTSDRELDFFSVLNLNMDEKQISVIPFDNETVVSFDGKTKSFSDIYLTGGALGIGQAIEKSYGIKVDRFIDVTESNFKRVMSYLGDVEITSDEKVNYKGKDFVLFLEEGVQSATGETVLSYYKYLDKDGRGNLTAEIIDYYLNSGKLSADQDSFDSLINLVNTNISAKDFSLVSKTANAFINDSSRNKTVCVSYSEVTDNG